MKTLFYKDLRENFKLALVGLAVLALLLPLSFQTSLGVMHRITLGQTNATDALQPLLSQTLLVELLFFCGIFGAALGWLQTRNEAHRDLWAFLIHRPVTRAQIFRAKASAGLCLYALGAGLPLLGFIAYVRQPGHVAAPFEWAMTLPILAAFLTGIAYYFAGQLTGLRQARWFGSRTFGLGAALLTSTLTFAGPPGFWQVLVAILLPTLLLAIAVRGAYASGGFFLGQPILGRLALTLCLLSGSTSVLLLTLALASSLFRINAYDAYVWHSYRMSPDGTVWIVTSRDGVESYTDLAGQPLIDPATGQKMNSVRFNQLHPYTETRSAVIPAGQVYRQQDRYMNVTHFFTLWNISDKVLWYVDRHGKLTGYNSVTRRHVGDLVPPEAGGGGQFIPAGYWNNYFNAYNLNAYNLPGILATSNTVYQVDLAGRKLTPIFTAPDTDPIAGFTDYSLLNQTNAALVLTRHTIQLVDINGATLLSLPYQPDYVTYPMVEVTSLPLHATNRFAVWFHPDYILNDKSGWKLPIHVLWVGPANQVVKTADLPTLQENTGTESGFDRVMDCLVPPILQFSLIIRGWNMVHLLPAAFCTLVGWRITRRYHLPGTATAGWLAFIFLLGIPGLLTFFCAPDWPSRENCPACKKLRTVDRENCEHCAAPFPPPEKIGIEIFAPL